MNTETKTHIDKLRDATYLGGYDLMNEQGQTVDKIVTIKEVTKTTVFNQKSQTDEQCITVYFAECKPIILNATNRKRLKKHHGPFVEDMVGQQIILTTERGKFFGEVQDVIRISTKPVVKPKLEGANIEKAKAGLLAKTSTMESLKARFTISAELEALLTNG